MSLVLSEISVCFCLVRVQPTFMVLIIFASHVVATTAAKLHSSRSLVRDYSLSTEGFVPKRNWLHGKNCD